MKHKRTVRYAIAAGTILLGALCAYGVFTYVVLDRGQSLETLLQELANTEAHVQELNALTRLTEESVTERTQLESLVLHEESVIDFLSLVETVAREQGLTIETDSLVVNERPDEDFDALSVSVHVTGSYDRVVTMLKLLENLPYQSSLDRIQMVSNRSAALGTQWDASVDLTVTLMREETS